MAGIQDFTGNAGQTMAMVKSIGQDAESIFNTFKKRRTQEGITGIMNDPSMNADQRLQAMRQLPDYAGNMAYQDFSKDYAKKQAAQEKIAESERKIQERLQYDKDLNEQRYQQEQGRPEDTAKNPAIELARWQKMQTDAQGDANRYESGRPMVDPVLYKIASDNVKYWSELANKVPAQQAGQPLPVDEVGDQGGINPVADRKNPFQPSQTPTDLNGMTRAGGKASTGMPVTFDKQDNAAIEWAKQNPNDPRAIKILEINGVK